MALARISCCYIAFTESVLAEHVLDRRSAVEFYGTLALQYGWAEFDLSIWQANCDET